MWVLVASVLIEIAWTLHLGPTLPNHYRAQHWSTAWVGLDLGARAGIHCPVSACDCV